MSPYYQSPSSLLAIVVILVAFSFFVLFTAPDVCNEDEWFYDVRFEEKIMSFERSDHSEGSGWGAFLIGRVTWENVTYYQFYAYNEFGNVVLKQIESDGVEINNTGNGEPRYTEYIKASKEGECRPPENATRIRHVIYLPEDYKFTEGVFED